MFLVRKTCSIKLADAVKAEAYEIQARLLVNQRLELEHQLTQTSDKEACKVISSEIQSVNEKYCNINLLPKEELYDIPPNSVNWGKISVQIVITTSS